MSSKLGEQINIILRVINWFVFNNLIHSKKNDGKGRIKTVITFVMRFIIYANDKPVGTDMSNYIKKIRKKIWFAFLSLKALKRRIQHFSVYRFLAERYPWSIENECVSNTWTFAKNMNGWLIKCDSVALCHNNSKFRRFWLLFIRAYGYQRIASKRRNGLNAIDRYQFNIECPEASQLNSTKPN